MGVDCSPGCNQAMADSQLFNQKLLQDGTAQLQQQSLTDNQADSRAWQATKLDQAQIASRRAQNAATHDKVMDTLVALGLAASQIATATAQTENEQTVSPAGTAASETTKGAVAAAGASEAVSAAAITANIANLFTALTPVIATAVAQSTAAVVTAILPVLVTAVGGASNSSKPAA